MSRKGKQVACGQPLSEFLGQKLPPCPQQQQQQQAGNRNMTSPGLSRTGILLLPGNGKTQRLAGNPQMVEELIAHILDGFFDLEVGFCGAGVQT